MVISGLIKQFFSHNRRLSHALERHFSGGKPTFAEQYNILCADWINGNPGLAVLDVGTGKRLTYAHLLADNPRHIIGCDISLEEIRHNPAIDEAVVCDASKSLALPDASVDFLTSHYCIEHLPDVSRFLQEAARVLKPGGRLCIIFAGGYSLHALLNKLLPHHLARKILYFFLPGTEVSAGFKAFYNLGTRQEFSDTLKAQGFQVDEALYRFGSRGYFTFFLPCFLVMMAADWLTERIIRPNRAADFIFIATHETAADKPADWHKSLQAPESAKLS